MMKTRPVREPTCCPCSSTGTSNAILSTATSFQVVSDCRDCVLTCEKHYTKKYHGNIDTRHLASHFAEK